MGSGPLKRSGREQITAQKQQTSSGSSAVGTSPQTGSQPAPESRGGGLPLRTQQPAVKMAEKGESGVIATTTHVFVVMGASVSVEKAVGKVASVKSRSGLDKNRFLSCAVLSS